MQAITLIATTGGPGHIMAGAVIGQVRFTVGVDANRAALTR
jgi:hypothetical protein